MNTLGFREISSSPSIWVLGLGKIPSFILVLHMRFSGAEYRANLCASRRKQVSLFMNTLGFIGISSSPPPIWVLGLGKIPSFAPCIGFWTEKEKHRAERVSKGVSDHSSSHVVSRKDFWILPSVSRGDARIPLLLLLMWFEFDSRG